MELANAARIIGNLPPNVVTQYPSGRWGFVGRVDGRLAHEALDGSELDARTLRDIASFGPGLFAHKARHRTWNTREEAIEAARELGIEVQS